MKIKENTKEVILQTSGFESILLQIPNEYEVTVLEDGNKNALILRRKKIYPESYSKCCKVLGIDYDFHIIRITHKQDLMATFYRLLVCRDAYWKIAGEQMGLGKSWEPEYVSLEDNTYFTIQTFNCEIDKSATSHRNAILAFPTIEMRDTFYENFKDLIEQCKELL